MQAADIEDKKYTYTQAWIQWIYAKLGKSEQRRGHTLQLWCLLDTSWYNTNTFSSPSHNTFFKI